MSIRKEYDKEKGPQLSLHILISKDKVDMIDYSQAKS